MKTGRSDREAVVRLDGVSKTYGVGRSAVVAVSGVTASVPHRARIALTGPSGSGKSTLLHLLAGLEQPTTGSVTWPALGGVAPVRGEIGVVFQGPSLVPVLDVVENVALPLVLAGVEETEAQDVAHSALASVGLAGLARRLPEELSGGQSQRVAVARALALRPALVLADEPTGRLDWHTAGEVLQVLVEAADEMSAALVVATHDPRVADVLTERWAVRDGTVESPFRGVAAAGGSA